jgi:regulator of replication initiation timing
VNTVFEIAVYLVGSFIFAAMSYTALSFYFANKKLANSVIDLYAQLESLQKRAQELIDQKASQSLENSDAFIRFVSQSREKAFEYIEDVQESIANLKDYFDKNGLNLSVNQAEEFSEKLEKVLSYLPEDSKND